MAERRKKAAIKVKSAYLLFLCVWQIFLPLASQVLFYIFFSKRILQKDDFLFKDLTIALAKHKQIKNAFIAL